MRYFGVALLLCLWLAVPVHAATIAQYDSALHQVQQALEARIPVLQAHEIPSDEPPQFVARRLLSPIHSVGPAGGPQTLVRNDILFRQLNLADHQGNIAQMQALDRQISTLRAELAIPNVISKPSKSGDPVTIAHTILARPDFASTPFPPSPLLDRLSEWLSREWAKIHWHHINLNPNLPPPNFGFIKVLLWLMLLGAAVILVVVLVQLLSRRQRSTKVAPLVDAAEAALVEARDTDSLLAMAERQAREGQYRQAFRLVYVATLVALDSGGVLRFNRSRTNWEYLRALRASGREDVSRALLPLTRDFDRVWYGFAPAGPAEYADALAQYHALQGATQTPTRPVPTGVGV
jgi:hypothetical protein